MCEVFNATILETIISLCEWIRNYLMRRFKQNRDKVQKFKGMYALKFKRKKEKKRGFSIWAWNSNFEVKNGWEKFSVDLEVKICTCRKWELNGLSCMHATSSIFYKEDIVEAYIDDCYKKRSYIACYDPIVYPLNGPNIWALTNLSTIRPLCV